MEFAESSIRGQKLRMIMIGFIHDTQVFSRVNGDFEQRYLEIQIHGGLTKPVFMVRGNDVASRVLVIRSDFRCSG